MYLLYAAIAVVLVALDQITKLVFFGKSFSVIGDFLWIEGSALNKGAAGGIFSGQIWLFITLAVVAMGVIVYFVINKKFSSSKFFKITLAVLFAGIVGNLIDRILLGGVRDFIYFKFINFYIFNFADIYLTIGTILLCVYVLFMHKEKPSIDKKEKEKNE